MKKLIISCLFIYFFTAGHARAQSTDPFAHTFSFEASVSSFYWHTGPWRECGKTLSGDIIKVCGDTVQFRTVECRDNQNNRAGGTSASIAASEALCNHTTKPDVSQSCKKPDCVWISSGWSSCTPGCGSSCTETQQYDCWDPDDLVPNNHIATSCPQPKPSDSRTNYGPACRCVPRPINCREYGDNNMFICSDGCGGTIRRNGNPTLGPVDYGSERSSGDTRDTDGDGNNDQSSR